MAQVEEMTEEFRLIQANRSELAPVVLDWGHRAGDPSMPGGQEAGAAYLLGKVHELLQLPAQMMVTSGASPQRRVHVPLLMFIYIT